MKLAFYLPAYWPEMTYPVHRLYDETVEQAVLAERIGMSSLWIPEHHFVNLFLHPSPLLTAVRVAAATKNIRIGTNVLVLPFYDMRRLAGEIAQADQLMHGRLEVGVGRGAFKYEFDRLGIPLSESRERFDESLSVLESLLRDTDVSSDSTYYKYDTLTVTPRPFQNPAPPMWIAAVQPEAIYHCARRGYNVTTTALRSPFEEAEKQVKSFKRGRDEAKVAIKPRLSVLRMGFVCRNEADVSEKLKLAAANDQRHHNLRSGDGEVVAGGIIPRETGRTEADLRNALLIGTVSEIIAKLRRYADLDVDELVLNMSFGASHSEVMRSMEVLAKEVMPEITQVASHA